VVDSGLLNNPLSYYVLVVRKTKDRYTILRFYAKQVANPENQEFMMKSDDYVWIRSIIFLTRLEYRLRNQRMHLSIFQ